MAWGFRNDFLNAAFLLFLTALLYGIGLGSFGLLDPDEPFYCLTAKEMLERHQFLTPILFGEPQFEKPIFFFWVLCALFKLFGVTEWAARLGPLAAGVLTVIVTYFWGRVLFKRTEIAFLSALILATGAQFVVTSRVVLTDMFLCLFVTAALFCFSLGYRYPRYRKPAWVLIFFFSALGFLTKGPLGILLPILAIVPFLVLSGQGALLREIPWSRGGFIFLIVGIPWYAYMTVQAGGDFLKHFFLHENLRRFFVAEHKGMDRFFLYPGGLLFGFFPWSAFVLMGLWYGLKESFKAGTRTQKAFLFLSVSFLTIFAFFMAARSKLLSYTFPIFPAAALLSGSAVYRLGRWLGRGRGPGTLLLILNFFFWAIFPSALVGAAASYDMKNEVGVFGPLAAVASFLIPLSWLSFLLFWKRRLKAAVGILVLTAFLFASVSFLWLLPAAEGNFSSRRAVGFYRTLAGPEESHFLLASKLFVRGVAYYTGNPNVAILTDNPKRVFYTRHPVLVFSSTEDLLKIPGERFPVYCFLRQKELRFLNKIAQGNFSVTVLKAEAQRALVRLDRTS